MDNIESALSTQKIAMVFVRCLIGVWILAIILTVLFALKFYEKSSVLQSYLVIILLLLIGTLLLSCKIAHSYSETKNMKKSIYGDCGKKRK